MRRRGSDQVGRWPWGVWLALVGVSAGTVASFAGVGWAFLHAAGITEDTGEAAPIAWDQDEVVIEAEEDPDGDRESESGPATEGTEPSTTVLWEPEPEAATAAEETAPDEPVLERTPEAAEAAPQLVPVEPEAAERGDRVRRERHPGADLAQLARPLEHRRGPACLRQRDGGREPADAAADHDRRPRHAVLDPPCRYHHVRSGIDVAILAPVPRTNPERRRALTDAAIGLLVDAGVHGLSHRSVERAAGLPAGTAANYFRGREELLVATAERIVELHLADARAATVVSVADAPVHPDPGTDAAGRRDETLERMTDLLAASLLDAATRHRDRYLAIAELQLEARRRPALAQALAGLATQASDLTAAMHADTGLDVDPAAVPTLVLLYGGALLTLVTGAVPVDDATTRRLARAMVHGSLAPAS